MSGRLHLIGVGGIGMSALAEILLARGWQVSGSDLRGSELTERLAAKGAAVSVGHRAEQVEGADRVVVSDAIHDDNPELARAKSLGIPVTRRSELLAELMAESRGLAVAGTHGKTTVTAMVGLILAEAGMDPTVVVGGECGPLGGNARVGRGEWLVAEACEAYESFLDLRPEVAVVTNIEADHLDHHGTEEHLRGSFAAFLRGTAVGGTIVLSADRPELRSLPLPEGRRVVWCGFDQQADVRGVGAEAVGLSSRCALMLGGREAGDLAIGAPGLHNTANALAATAAALAAGAPLEACRRALRGFSGVGRRFEPVGERDGVSVIDDYAHHPTEIAATLAAARRAFPGRRIVAVFQPHLYSRTRDFAAQFAQALAKADLVVLTEIYPAREAPLPGVTSALIADGLRGLLPEDAVVEMAKRDLVSELPPRLRPRDVVLVMGAGDIGDEARALLATAGNRGRRVVTKR